MSVSGELKDAIFREVERLEDDMTKSLCRILRFPAVSPHNGGTGEEEKTQETAKLIGELGLLEGARLEWIRIPDEKSRTGDRPSIILRTPGKAGEKSGEKARRLWIFAHSDVVSEGDRTLWETDPFEPVVKDGKIYARGADDNGQPGIAMLYALKALKNLNITPEYEICSAFVADEEMGSHYSIEPIVKQGLAGFRKDDMILVPDSGNKDGDFVETAEKGLLQMEFTITGRQCHASLPGSGLNACRAANLFSVELDEALHKAFPDSDKLFSPETSTFEPTRRYTNVVSVNVIPGVEKLSFDCRVLPHIKLDDVVKTAEKVMKDVTAGTGAKIELNVINRHDPAPATSEDSLIARILSKAITETLGVKPKFGGIGGGTFAAFFRHEGIPSAVWSQNTDDRAHQPNEYTEIKYMVNNAKVFALMMAGI